MAQKRILIKLPNGSIRPFSERAAKIAIENLGGVEMTAPDKPAELNIKIKVPPQITQPIPLKKPEIVKPPELGTKTVKAEPVTKLSTGDYASAGTPVKTEVKQETVKSPVKNKGGRKATKK